MDVVQAEADFRELVESVDALQLGKQQQGQQQQQPMPSQPPQPAAAVAAAAERARAEAARLSSDNAALRRRLERTHRLVGAMQARPRCNSEPAQLCVGYAVAMQPKTVKFVMGHATINPDGMCNRTSWPGRGTACWAGKLAAAALLTPRRCCKAPRRGRCQAHRVAPPAQTSATPRAAPAAATTRAPSRAPASRRPAAPSHSRGRRTAPTAGAMRGTTVPRPIGLDTLAALLASPDAPVLFRKFAFAAGGLWVIFAFFVGELSMFLCTLRGSIRTDGLFDTEGAWGPIFPQP